MDAVKFLQERDRMYKSGAATPGIGLEDDYDIASVVQIVEKWSAEHPRKTRQSVFLEQWPNAIVEYEVLTICPKIVLGRENWMRKGCGGVLCSDCRREFWLEEVE